MVRDEISRLKLLPEIFSWNRLSLRTRRFPADITLPFCFHITTYLPRLLTVQVRWTFWPATTLITWPVVTISGNISPLFSDWSLLLLIYLKVSPLRWCLVLLGDKLAPRKSSELCSVEWEKGFNIMLSWLVFLLPWAYIPSLYTSILNPEMKMRISNTFCE